MQNFIREYISDDEFKITLFKNRVNVINYKELLNIGKKEIVLTSNDSKIYIYGNDLALSKLLDDEILISGIVTKIEVNYE